MLVQGIAVIDAVVIFVGPCQDDIAPGYGIDPILHHKGHIPADIDIKLTLGMGVGMKGIARGIPVDLRVGNLKRECLYWGEEDRLTCHLNSPHGDFTIFLCD